MPRFTHNTLRVRSFGIGFTVCNGGAWYHVRFGRLSIAIIPQRRAA